MNSTPRPSKAAAPVKTKELDFKEIAAKLAAWNFPAGLDGIVAIATGGAVPAALVAQKLGLGLKTISINYRNEDNEPQFAHPKLLSSIPGLGDWKRVLLVDDLYLSGKSWNAARAFLSPDVEVLPFVLKGNVDFALIRTTDTGAHWPWSAS